MIILIAYDNEIVYGNIILCGNVIVYENLQIRQTVSDRNIYLFSNRYCNYFNSQLVCSVFLQLMYKDYMLYVAFVNWLFQEH